MVRVNRHRSLIMLSTALAASLTLGAMAGPVGAAPEAEKAEQRAAVKAERAAERDARKAERDELKAERDELKAERAALRDARKDELEERKVEARTQRETARAQVASMRRGLATLDGIRVIRDGYRDAFHELMAMWRAERDELLPNRLSEAAEEPDGVLEEQDEDESEES